VKKPVARLYSVIDIFKQRLVHFFDAGKRPLTVFDDVCVIKVRI
jgi:hypothetical protein